MSSLLNIITTEYRAQGSQALAYTRMLGGEFTNLGRKINDTSRMSERLNNQFKAIGTTIRYAIAGQAVFGLTRMVGQLRDVQQQMGLIAATGDFAGPMRNASQAVDQLGKQLQQTAIDSLTPIQDINDATINYLSTVQGVKPSEIPDIIKSIGQAAKLSQTPVEDLTKAATTMNIAFGRRNDIRSISEFNRMWWALIKTAPGGISAAPQIAQQLPSLASMFMLAPGKQVSGRTAQAQLMSLTLGAVRTGAPPAVALRGLTYLLQSVAQPTGGAKEALAGIGITPQFVEQRGIYAALMRLLGTVTKVSPGTRARIQAIPEEALDEGATLPGISAEEMTRLRKMIPRIHGIRAAVILASQMQRRGNVESLQQDLGMMQKGQDDQLQGTKDLAKAWDQFRRRAKLQEAAIAVNTLSLQVAQVFEPILNLAATGIAGVGKAAQHHRGATRAAVLGAAAIVGTLAIRRGLGLGGIAGRALPAVAAAKSIAEGRAPTGAPNDPFFVVVVGNMFGPGGTWRKVATAGETAAETAAGTAATTARRGGFFSRIARFAPFALSRVALPVAASYAALDAWYGGDWGRVWKDSLIGHAVRAAHGGSGDRARAAGLLPGMGAGLAGGGLPTLRGKADVNLNIDVKRPDGKSDRRTVHVPLDLWANGATPSQGGKPAKARRTSGSVGAK